MSNTQDKPRLIRRSEVIQRVGLCKASIYNRMNAGLFPRPVSIGGRSVAWLESDIDTWITERLAEAGRIAA
jgi:prophage regulatory protein